MKKYMKEIILLIVCIAVFAGAVCALIGIWNMYHKGQEEYEDLRGFVDDPEDESEPESDGGNGETEIDFDGLKTLNPDIVAWIRCDELGIDYPVVQGADNDYYLNRTFMGEEHIAGCIFMDYRNKVDFSDQKTILYGHNMKDGSMFGRLKDFTGLEEVLVSVYLPDRVLVYTAIEGRQVRADDECYRIGYSGGEASEGSGQELLLSTCTGDSEVRLVITCVQSEILCND